MIQTKKNKKENDERLMAINAVKGQKDLGLDKTFSVYFVKIQKTYECRHELSLDNI